jgi:hypothetical protein
MSETISITTYLESEPIALKGDKGSGSTIPGWSGILGDSKAEKIGTGLLVRRDVPVETIERELQKLIDLMNRVFSQAEQSSEPKSTAEPVATPTIDKKRLQLKEVSLAVEITAEGGLSILGTGGKLGGKGGITLKFTKD